MEGECREGATLSLEGQHHLQRGRKDPQDQDLGQRQVMEGQGRPALGETRLRIRVLNLQRVGIGCRRELGLKRQGEEVRDRVSARVQKVVQDQRQDVGEGFRASTRQQESRVQSLVGQKLVLGLQVHALGLDQSRKVTCQGFGLAPRVSSYSQGFRNQGFEGKEEDDRILPILRQWSLGFAKSCQVKFRSPYRL